MNIVDTGYVAYRLAKYDGAYWNAYTEFFREKAVYVFDSPESLRKQEFPHYKAQRQPDKDPEYFQQVLSLKRLMRNDRLLVHYELLGYEADDLIGLLCYTCHHENILSSKNTLTKIYGIDKDLLMLPNIQMIELSGEPITYENFVNSTNVPKTLKNVMSNIPNKLDKRWNIFKLLVIHGDIADNIFPLGKGKHYLEDIAKMWYEKNFFQQLYDEYGENTMVNAKLAMLPHYSLINEELTLDYLDALCHNETQIEINTDIRKLQNVVYN